MKKIFIGIILSISVNFVVIGKVLSWNENVTHRDISKIAAAKSVLSRDKGDYMKTLGFNKELIEEFKWNENKRTVEAWIQEGTRWEDIPTSRSFNHFHNPLKPWNQAGLDDWIVFHLTGKSSLLWAQDGSYQQSSVNEDWSLEKTREYYYIALTSINNSLRQENFAKTFKGLGHQMHLVQDMAVPDHVRNDAHPEDAILGKNPLNGSAYFETWTKEKGTFIKCLLETHASLPPEIISKCQQYGINEGINIDDYYPVVSFNVSYNGLTPISQFYDAEEYHGTNPSTNLTQGLAEYTNANFFSEDTIFAAERYSSDYRHYFPYPKKSSTDLLNYLAGLKPEETVVEEDGETDTGIWISKTSDGENVSHIVRTGKLSKLVYTVVGEGALFYETFYRDEKCHEDYAQKLIPRAVGYSAGLLDYFFRGVLEISAPDEYIYGITDGGNIFSYTYTDDRGNTYTTQQQLFSRIKAKVVNITPKEKDPEGNILSYEDIVSGSLIAVARYKVIPNYSPDLANYPPDGSVMMNDIDYRYSVSLPITLTPEQIASLNTQPTEFTFDFTGNEIPAGITDLTLQVIFKGTLGNETDIAVSIGMKDLKEPTHQVFWNLTDMFSLYVPNDNTYHLYTADEIRANPDLLLLTNGAYIDPHTMTFEISYMPESPPADPVYTAARITDLPDGRYIRVIALADDELTYPYVRMAWHVELPDRAPEDGDNDYYFETVINQDYGGTWYAPTEATLFRTVKRHFGVGVLRCEPVAVDPITGNSYCAYPEEEAIIPPDLAPYPAEIMF